MPPAAAGLARTERASDLQLGSQHARLETAQMFALAWTHTALTLHLFVSFWIHSKLGSGTYGYICNSFRGADSSSLPLEFDIGARFCFFREHDYREHQAGKR